MLTKEKPAPEPAFAARMIAVSIVAGLFLLIGPYLAPLWCLGCLVPAIAVDVWWWRDAVNKVRQRNEAMRAGAAAARKRIKELDAATQP
jgi:hypothetical protein